MIYYDDDSVTLNNYLDSNKKRFSNLKRFFVILIQVYLSFLFETNKFNSLIISNKKHTSLLYKKYN